MSISYNSFSLQDSNFITEKVEFKGFASRGIVRGNVARREGVKLLSDDFGEKKITIEGVIIASSSAELQTLVDNLKKNITDSEADLIVESDRTFKATVDSLSIPDEHYNNSKTDFKISFICSKPYAEGSELTAVIPVVSGRYTISGSTVISGTFYNRPTLVFDPSGAASGNTLIRKLDIYFVEKGQTVTVSGLGNGLGMDYGDTLTINLDSFSALEGTSEKDMSGGFPEISVGTLTFTVTSDKQYPGGTLTLRYKPRYA